MRNFNEWLSKFRSSIANYGYYIDFDKVYRNVNDIKVELNILNTLIGSTDIENDFKNIITKYPETLKCIPILLAVRANEIYAIDGDGEFSYNFKKANYSPEQYAVFMRKTGLFELLEKHIIHTLVDYVTGVETGLDSNGRKNRGGHLMEDFFVQRNKLSSNIIVDSNTAKTAKSISDIRNILGVWTSDNLTNARYVLVVEGEDDKISLSKLLPHFSAKLSEAIRTNMLVIKSLGGAGNLCHDINDLRSSMCQYVVLLDNDDAGKNAAQKALDKNLLKNSEVKYTICNGSPEAEFEDCLNPNFYAEVIKNEFSVDINCQQFRGNKKWSERMKNTFLSQGSQWNDEVEEKVKYIIAQTIPSKITESNDILISAKSGFLNGLVTALETMLDKETKQ